MDAGTKVSIRFAFLAASVLAFCAYGPTISNAQGNRGGTPGDFDYYILAMSWSPTYCEGRGGEGDVRRDDYDRDSGADRGGNDRYGGSGDRRGYGRGRGDGPGDSGEQCGGIRPYAFVLHGLWPQYDRRGWPERCETAERPWVPEGLISQMMDIMPSRRLVIQEYKKHGVCSGLDPRRYFEAARSAYLSIHIPEQFQDLSKPLTVSPEEVRRAFVEANKQLSPDMIQVVCSRNLLRELRVCFSKDLTPRSCSQGEQDRRLCTYDSVIMPPVRGGGVGPRGGPSQQGGRL
jgi:ribonuclease T2